MMIVRRIEKAVVKRFIARIFRASNPKNVTVPYPSLCNTASPRVLTRLKKEFDSIQDLVGQAKAKLNSISEGLESVRNKVTALDKLTYGYDKQFTIDSYKKIDKITQRVMDLKEAVDQLSFEFVCE